MANDKLTGDFITELLKTCLLSRTTLEVCRQYLKYTYISSEPHKYIWQEILGYYNLHEKIPSIGVLSELLKKKEGISIILAEMKKSNKPDEEGLLAEFDEFIKMNMFVEGYDLLADQWNDDKKDVAYDTLVQLGTKIAQFSVTQGTQYAKVFNDFHQRHKDRLQESEDLESDNLGPLCFGIHALDYYQRGRLALGDTVLLLAQSGVGKSLALRWIAMANARKGRRIVHFQAEDTKKLCLEQYDALWSGTEMDAIRTANIPDNKLAKMTEALQKLKVTRGEIIVESFESFGSGTMLDCHRHLSKIEQTHGKIDMIIYDYLEKFEPGDGKKYSTTTDGERNRRRAIGDKMKNLSMEFNAVGVTATQASNVKREFLDNPDWFMTRENISDFKAIVDPFSYFFTFNQTKDEYGQELIRIYIDKMRKAAKGQLVPIYMNRDVGRFYDNVRTLSTFWDKDLNKLKLN